MGVSSGCVDIVKMATEANTDSAALVDEKRKSRLNTKQERNGMKRLRRNRKMKDRKMREVTMSKALETEQAHRKESESKLYVQKSIARCFWERWQWEVHNRRQLLSKASHQSSHMPSRPALIGVREIDSSELQPSDGDSTYIGRGSFGVVKLVRYRGIDVAVKELLPHTLLVDVQHEATIMSRLSHPSMPLLFGIYLIQAI